MNTVIPREQIERIAASDNYISSCDKEQKLKIIDEISKKQPLLLLEIRKLHKFKVPDKKFSLIIDFLLILYDYFTDRGKTELPVVTKEIIEEVRTNVKWLIKLYKMEGHSEGAKLILRMCNAYPRLEAIICFTSLLQNDIFKENDDGNDHCMYVGKIILDCFTKVGENVKI